MKLSIYHPKIAVYFALILPDLQQTLLTEFTLGLRKNYSIGSIGLFYYGDLLYSYC